MTWALAGPLGERARNAVFVHAAIGKRETAHGGKTAPLGNLVAPRAKAGGTVPKRRFCVFSFTKRTRVFSYVSTIFLQREAGRFFFRRRGFPVLIIQIQRNRFPLAGAPGEKKAWRVETAILGREPRPGRRGAASRARFREATCGGNAFSVPRRPCSVKTRGGALKKGPFLRRARRAKLGKAWRRNALFPTRLLFLLSGTYVLTWRRPERVET